MRSAVPDKLSGVDNRLGRAWMSWTAVDSTTLWSSTAPDTLGEQTSGSYLLFVLPSAELQSENKLLPV